MGDQGRNFIGTHANPKMESVEKYLELWHTKAKASYVTGQVEKAASGLVHIQYYLHFDSNKRRGWLRKHCDKSHYTTVKVNNGADDYCMKEDTRIEGPWSFGVKQARLNVKGDKARKNAELLAMGPEEAMRTGVVGLGKQYLDLVKATELYNLRIAVAVRTEKERGVYYWGPSHSGKSYKAREDYPDAYIKD